MTRSTVNFPLLPIQLVGQDLGLLIAELRQEINGSNQQLVATANPEFIVAATQNSEFLQVLQQAALTVCDGVGLQLATRWLTGHQIPRITGVELAQSLLMDQAGQFKIFLLGGAPGIAQKVAMRYSETVVGAASGGQLTKDYFLTDQESVINQINHSGANVILVAFGQVKQELWIARHLQQLPTIKIAIGVGGTFDYLSGSVARAPKLMRQLGLEWFYRLIRQPQRLPRIINATIRFSWLVFKFKLHGK